MIRRFSCIVVIISICGILPAREKINLDKGWEFAFGNASSPALDFGCGTEYFTYLTKAASIHNEGPYSQSFDKSKWPAQWKTVDLPQDASSQGTYTDDNYIRAQRQKAFETTLHAQYSRILGYWFELKAGMGVNLYRSPDGSFFWGVTPEVDLAFDLQEGGEFHLRYGLKRQNLFQLGITNIGLPK